MFSRNDEIPKTAGVGSCHPLFSHVHEFSSHRSAWIIPLLEAANWRVALHLLRKLEKDPSLEPSAAVLIIRMRCSLVSLQRLLYVANGYQDFPPGIDKAVDCHHEIMTSSSVGKSTDRIPAEFNKTQDHFRSISMFFLEATSHFSWLDTVDYHSSIQFGG